MFALQDIHSGDIIGCYVFSTKEKAQQFLDEDRKVNPFTSEDYHIIEVEIDPIYKEFYGIKKED